MVGATDSEQAVILKWVVRLLYVVLFIPWMVAYPLLSVPITFPYLGAITILVFLGLTIANEKDAFEELDDMYIEDISGFCRSSTDI